jgi:phage tail-like protein
MPILPVNAAISLVSEALGMRRDPYGSFNFLVEIDGIIAGGFSEVSGLQIETEVESYNEGGVNDYIHQLPKGTKYTNIVLKHGLTDLDMLWNWYKDVIQGKINRKNGIIFLLDNDRIPVMWWEFYEAYPVKWIGPELKADSNSIAFETLELAHHGITKPVAGQILSGIKGAMGVSGQLF